MAIPHVIFKQKARRRLIGKEGKERKREIQKLLAEMPGYKTGPYADVRKWLIGELGETKQRSKAKARQWFAVKKQGDSQVVLVGPPNIGKSSLLKSLSDIQIKIANYEFTTLKPIPAIIDFNGALVQLVEIPGLLEGATEGKGGGKAMISAARNADYLILMTSVDTSIEKLKQVILEIEKSNLPFPRFLICNKMDLPGAENVLKTLKKNFDLEIIPIAIEKDIGIKELREKIWSELGLIRIFPKTHLSLNKRIRPVVLPNGTAIKNFLDEIGERAREQFKFAKIWGPSAKFPGQEVGLSHLLKDGDIVEIHNL